MGDANDPITQAPCTLAAMFSPRMVALAVLPLSAGCAHLPACPGEGGPRWTEWSSPHFRVLTDVDDDKDAETLATQLEHFRAAIVAAAWRDVPDTGEPIEVAALRGWSEADVFLPPRTGGLFFNYLGTGIVVAPATNQVARENMLKHEIVHALMRQLELDRKAPVWFKEGMAMYLAMTAYDESSDKVIFGAPDLEALKTGRLPRSLAVASAVDVVRGAAGKGAALRHELALRALPVQP